MYERHKHDAWKKHSAGRFFSNIFYYNVSPMSISGNGLWQSNVIAEVKNLSTVKSKHMESITGRRFFFFSPSDNSNDCNTEANPISLLTKGCESLTVNYQMSIRASLEMESVDLVFDPHVHTKTNQCDRRYQIWGAFTFWPTYKVVHFPKIGKKKKKQKSWTPLLWRERSHTGSRWLASLASWDAGHALVPDGLLCSMLFRWCSGPCAVPPASDRSSSPTKTGVKVAFVRAGLEEGGNGAGPP